MVSGFKQYKDVVFSDKGIMCALYVCWGTRKDNGKGIVWGNDHYPQAPTSHTAHDPHAPALPPSSGILPPCRRFSLSKGHVAVSLSVPLPPCAPSQQVLHMVLRAWWGVPPPQVSSGVSLGGRGSEGGAGGRGGEQCHAFLPSPALWVSIPYMCVPTASITFWDCGHAMCVLPRPCPACMEKQAYFCGM